MVPSGWGYGGEIMKLSVKSIPIIFFLIMSKHPLTTEQKRLLDLYLSEIAATGVWDRNPDAYLYLRGLTHVLVQGHSIKSYVKYRRKYSKHLHFIALAELPRDSEFRKLIMTFALINCYRSNIKSRKAYLENCWLETAERATV